MKRTIMMMLCLIGMAVSLQAQTLSGKLVNEQNEPLAYTNVVLQQVDSIFMDGKTSDEKGDFRFSKVAAGDYRLVNYINLLSKIGNTVHDCCVSVFCIIFVPINILLT